MDSNNINFNCNPNNVQRRLAQRISHMIQESNLLLEDYDHSLRVSKYMKLARKELEFVNPNDLSYEANLLLKTHEILKNIAAKLK